MTYELRPYEYLDENGQYHDGSGDRSIYTTYRPGLQASLRIQATPTGLTPEDLRARWEAGEIAEYPGVAGKRIHVDAPEGVEIEPARDNEDWRTDERGVFTLRITVPRERGSHTFLFRSEDSEVRALPLSITVESPNWVLWLLLAMLGGLALLLTGMSAASEGLQAAAGRRFRETLHTVTRNPLRGLLAGLTVTFLAQSSSATTVMLVGFVRAGLITLRDSLGPIFGAAIGTTLTVQLLAFKMQTFALPLVAVGFLLSYGARNAPRAAALGKVLFGFGVIFFGMDVMAEAMGPLRGSPGFREVLATLTGRPLHCFLVTTVFTALIQSSGATIGIALALASQGLLTLEGALPIIFGANVGTTVTAILASIGGSTEAKRVAVAHLLFKIFAVAVFSLPLLFDALIWMAAGTSRVMAEWFPGVPFMEDTPMRRMANADTLLCVISAVVALVAGRGVLEKAVVRLVPQGTDEKKEDRAKFLDLALLESPQLAIGAATREISRMARFVEEMVKGSLRAIETRDPELLAWLSRRDDKVDRAFDRINLFLTQVTGKVERPEDMDRAIGLLYVINDLESVGDLVVKILVPLVNKMIDMDLHLSEEGMADVRELHLLVNDSLAKAILALTTPGEIELCDEVIQRQEEMQTTGRRLHQRHLRRLREGQQETLDTSSVHLDLINYLLRMHYHIFSIAWTVRRGVTSHEEAR